LTGIRFPTGAGNSYFTHRVYTRSGAQQAFYLTGTRGSLPGREADHSPPSSAEVKNA